MSMLLKPIYGLQLFVILGMSVDAIAASWALSNAPLPVSTTVKPNVMLLVDNSGSMDNIIYDADFFALVDSSDPNSGVIDRSSQQQWQYYNSSGSWSNVSNTAGNYYKSSFKQGSCSSNYDRFRNASTTSITKCLKLPDPVGSGDTRYSGEYVNYLLNRFASGTDLSTGASGNIPNETRMMVAKAVGADVVDNTAGMRFGVARFYGPSGHSYGHGATIDQVCGSSISSIKSSLSGYSADTNTPLSEALYEITRYFRGLSSYYHSSTSYSSPIQYRCQKNFTLAITDGFPTRDSNFPSNDPDVPAGQTLTDWDGLHPATSSSDYPSFPQYSDGYDSNGTGEGATLYLDDIAKFAWDTDFKKNASENDLSGVGYNDAAFPVQNMYTYTVGFATQNQMLEDAAEYGNGKYYTASNAAQLSTVLKNALADITKKSGSSSSAAASTGRIQTGSSVYQARYNSSNWSGEFLSFEIDTTVGSTYGQVKTTGSATNGAVFDAGKKIPAWNSRVIVTNKAAGIAFDWSQFSAAEKTSYFNGQEAMLQYLRGRNVSDTAYDVSIYRDRVTNLGDIVHSTPYFVGAPAARYSDSFESVAYSSFVTTHKNRDKILYVGANDGMLHAFEALTGVEKMAFIPGSLLPNLKELSDPNYSHQYYVDGSPTVVDAFDGTAWKTVLVGGLNKGGQGIYALDITDPSAYSESNAASLFMWEFTDEDDVDLGYSYSRPKIVKLQDGKWYAVFGNGYNNTEADGYASSSGNAVIYIVDLWDKTNVIKISTGVGTSDDPTNASRPNGFSTLTPVDLNGDQVADYVYGGDLFGNVWKFNLNDVDPTKWKLDYKLYSACSADPCTKTTGGTVSNAQPITTAVTVGKSKSGIGQMVYFGTGQYIEVTDNNGALGGRQTFYGIHDKGANVTGRSQLLQQTITIEASVNVTDTKGTVSTVDDVVNSYPLRETSNNYATTAKKGWFLDMVPPAGERGERLISIPAIRGKRLLFVTNIPANDPCSPGGDSWLMSLDAFTGGRLNQTYDLDKDGKFGTGDKVFGPTGNPVVASGIKVGSGGNAPSFMPGADSDQVIISGNDQLETMRIDEGDDVNRQSWQQITR
ncbi:pilus assembly protein [Neptunomonas japonica]|uniref:Type IV pilus assembly protein PilY1 n=1 Tax=Neptunomonas japonica JAMM 1380 TaxID=1441457 RepID=A0A7R6SX94_9GAMM|nr:PilC/PilY family type IV pilus protein [Neptunomonas japonica]BBB31300.1 type IV pilus assembly protein PilY1 [Neptunomonas japonica JAMM 1380]